MNKEIELYAKCPTCGAVGNAIDRILAGECHKDMTEAELFRAQAQDSFDTYR